MSTDVLFDPYARSAEFYDVMATPHWPGKRELLVRALRETGPLGLPLLDIGAGSGLSTLAVAEAVPEVAVHAVEPSAAMRSALMSRILAHDLADRVTVHAERIEDLDIPDELAGVSMMGVVGYLDPVIRHDFWAALRARLAPGAPVVVEFMPLAAPVPVPETTIAHRAIGHRSIEIRIGGEPASETTQHWIMRYLVREGDRVVRDFTAEHLWHTIGIDRLRTEAAAHGMTCEQVAPIIGVLRPESG